MVHCGWEPGIQHLILLQLGVNSIPFPILLLSVGNYCAGFLHPGTDGMLSILVLSTSGRETAIVQIVHTSVDKIIQD